MSQSGASRTLADTIAKADELSQKSRDIVAACKAGDVSRAFRMLRDFATQDVKRLTDKETLHYVASAGLSVGLGIYVEEVLKRPLNTGSGRIISKPFSGCSVALHGPDGNLVAYYSTKDVEGKVNFSVLKNLATIVLEAYNPSSKGEITNPRNMERLKEEGLEPGKNDYLFLGGVKPFTLKIGGEEKRVYLAVGNCRLTDDDFIEELRPLGKIDENSMAGAAERALAELIALKLQNPDAPSLEPYKSEFFEGIRLRPLLREEDAIYN